MADNGILIAQSNLLAELKLCKLELKRCRPSLWKVVKIVSLSIVTITAQATDTIGEMPFNPAGIKLRNQKVLPSYDWIAKPAPEPPNQKRGTKN